LQDKLLNISPVKQRILLFIDYLHISKREFYEKTGISRGTMDNNTGITEDTLAKLIATYKNINPSWLLIGAGDMLTIENSTPSNNMLNESAQKEPAHCNNCEVLTGLIQVLKDQLVDAQKNNELFRNLISTSELRQSVSTPIEQPINKQSA
jgi:hypothetical protein